MNRNLWPLALLTTAMLALAVPNAHADGNCNNYGIEVNTYVFSSADCSSHEYVQYCDQGTGAGAGAGAGAGSGTGEAGASASAGTNCTQNNGDGNQTAGGGKGMGGPILGEIVWVPVFPDSSDVVVVDWPDHSLDLGRVDGEVPGEVPGDVTGDVPDDVAGL